MTFNKFKIIKNICFAQALIIIFVLVLFFRPLNQGHVTLIFLSVLLGYLVTRLAALRYENSKKKEAQNSSATTVQAVSLEQKFFELSAEDFSKDTANKEFNPLFVESEKMYRRIIENVESGIFTADLDGKVLYVNHAMGKILSYSTKHQIISLNINDELSDLEKENQKITKIMEEKKKIVEMEIKHLCKDNKEISLLLNCNYIFNDQGQPSGIEGMIVDITEKKILQESILHEKRKLELILGFDEKLDTIKKFEELIKFVVNETALILECKKCSLMLIHDKTKELYITGAKGLEKEIVQNTRVKIGEPIAGFVAQKRMPLLVKNIEYERGIVKRANRSSYLGRSFMCVPLVYSDGLKGVINVADKAVEKDTISIFDEIDLKILSMISSKIAIAIENVKLYKELSDLTVTDPMTQIFNYRRFSESLDYELKRVRRSKKALCITMIDLDKFKQYNDTYGHPEGDALLRKLGEIYKEQLRETDLICRYAGDEFCAILPDTDIEGAKKAMEKVRKTVESHPFKIKMTLSIGIAQYQDGLTKKDLIVKADKALYEAKHGGRNQICTSK